MTLKQIAELVGGRLDGPADLELKSVAALDSAGPDQLSFAVGKKYLDAAMRCKAGALLVPEELASELPHPKVVTGNPYAAFAMVANSFIEQARRFSGVDPRATVGEGCRISQQVTIHTGVHIGDGVVIGDEVEIHPGTVIGDGVEIGDGCLIYPNVTIYHGCRIGKRVIIHAGAVIGSDGFGYAQHNGQHIKIPQTGIVVIEDDVEIGANTVIDRATLGETRIGAGTKIDNLVQIAHNVTVGERAIIVGQVGVAGSASIGRGVMIGGQAGIVGHISIGDGAKIGAQSGVAQDVEPGAIVSGTPATDHRQFLRMATAMKRLPELVREVKALKKALGS